MVVGPNGALWNIFSIFYFSYPHCIYPPIQRLLFLKPLKSGFILDEIRNFLFAKKQLEQANQIKQLL
jgi:hypothetical protein